ncbi:hypothetical protein DFH06DRAFT_1150688 [Mycena polygramma]|nr:hypothetical protein DFH06DRAFT_1150688 [Mycena polygramma]
MVDVTQIVGMVFISPILEPSAVLFAPGSSNIAANIVQFLLGISVSLRSIANALSDAVLLNILPFIGTAWESATICEDIYRQMYSPFRLGRDSCPSYRAHTLNLLDTMRSSGISAVVAEASRKESWVYFMQPLFSTTSILGLQM